MARVRPRTTIYAVMPILACLIMAGGIVVSILRIGEYTAESVTAKPLPPRRPPDHMPSTKTGVEPTGPPETPAPTTATETAPTIGGEGPAPDEGGVDEKKDEGAIAPGGGGAVAPEADER